MLDSIYHVTRLFEINLISAVKRYNFVIMLATFYERHNVSRKSVNN